MHSEQIKSALIAGVFSTFVLAFLAWLNYMGDYGIWLMAPFGATAVLVFGVPQSPLAKPKNVIGGHMLTAMIGVVFSYYSADSAIMIGLAVGIAITLMMITKTIHPAAGANPILIIESSQSWDFLIMPVLAGTVFIVVCGFVATWFLELLIETKHKKTA
ncbi:HPP family protein [Pseudoalteromonas sp. P1-16-1b]|uniref:HPP family protein n=1 Tax=Pseudoalteromonas sp. P1-16-1b TaxID=1723757 RepID=UPI0006D68363|nr:HPP family protein [Pseudoalteromonas sp. P1-16-1b]KPZ64199.1 HPP family protein [Pseudoalteromonas sp. P1-16-1b]